MCYADHAHHVPNFHQNTTSNGVIITEGLKVRDYDRREGKILCDPTAFSEVMCCGNRDHVRKNDLDGHGSCTDHYCDHDHWFEVVYPDGTTDQFNGSRLQAI